MHLTILLIVISNIYYCLIRKSDNQNINEKNLKTNIKNVKDRFTVVTEQKVALYFAIPRSSTTPILYWHAVLSRCCAPIDECILHNYFTLGAIILSRQFSIEKCF